MARCVVLGAAAVALLLPTTLLVVNAGTTCWMRIQGVELSSQWYWYECYAWEYWGNEASFRSGYWGHPDRVPWSDFGYEYEEFAFAL